MAARLNIREVIELVQREDSDEDHSFESDEDVNEDEEKLGNFLESFDGGDGFNKAFFKENAIGVLMPLVQAAKPAEDLDEQPQRLKGIVIIFSFSFQFCYLSLSFLSSDALSYVPKSKN